MAVDFDLQNQPPGKEHLVWFLGMGNGVDEVPILLLDLSVL
jgi:hypothetical protein